ncbi:DUF4332 domain-containing protein [Planctomycetaceae bacterium SH139]
MLLEKIEIDSCGSLEQIHLGPFSHRLNVVFGPPGSGKTACLEFIRSVMLGSDRDWHRGASGRVVWADREGLVHCRRELDGTSRGRLLVDCVARDDRAYNHHYGYRTASNYQNLERLVELPRQLLDAIVAPASQIDLATVLAACQQAGLNTRHWTRDEAEISRVRQAIADLDRQLEGYTSQGETSDGLRLRRADLVRQLAQLDQLPRQSAADVERRARLQSRLRDTKDEIHRLRRQESDLRQSLSRLEDLLSSSRVPENLARSTADPQQAQLRIAANRRAQLVALDRQLVRLCKALRDIRGLREYGPAVGAAPDVVDLEAPVRFYNASARHQDYQFYDSRLDAVRHQLDWLLSHYDASLPPQDRLPKGNYDDAVVADPTQLGPNYFDHYYLDREYLDREYLDSDYRDRINSERLDLTRSYLDRSELDALLEAVRGLRAAIDKGARSTTDQHPYSLNLSASEETLTRAIRRMIDARQALLEKIADEHDLSSGQLKAAFGDWYRCHDQPHLYQWLLSHQAPSQIDETGMRVARRRRLESERAELLDELSRTVNRLDASVREARSVERQIAELPDLLPVAVDEKRQSWLREEIAEVDRRLRWLDSCQAAHGKRLQLTRRLDHLLAGVSHPSALIRQAQIWAEQLSSGKLSPSQVAQYLQSPAAAATAHTSSDDSSILRDEHQRRIVHLALRMAATDQLRSQGRQIPLLVDEPSATWLGDSERAHLADIFARYANHGNQLIVFTAHRGLANGMRSLGGHALTLVPRHYYQLRYRESADTSAQRINRELDTAWRESHGVYDDPHWYRQPTTNGYHQPDDDWSQSYPTQQRPAIQPEIELPSRVSRGPASPFFLTDDSPVDQAPSIDAVAAARLREQNITTVGDLLNADPRRVARRLNLADVSVEVVIRWQDEANLVCGVPQLRNFDARVLVGCGFTEPSQLASMHPGQLLEKVEAFLATSRGRQILRTGTSYELSRITSWIAAANRSVARRSRHGDTAERRSHRGSRSNRGSRASSRNRDRDSHSTLNYERGTTERLTIDGQSRAEREIAERERLERESTARARATRERTDRERTDRESRAREKTSRRQKRFSNNHSTSQQQVRHSESSSASSHETRELRFYLELNSPIVDAPSIGPKTAKRLETIGYRTVRQFIEANPATIAAQLNHHRLTKDRITTWQQQSTLMCQVPMLRGHDVQLLIEANVITPEQLASAVPAQLFTKIDRVARSSEGKRILRGANLPDLEEINDWIRWAADRRSLKAA